MLTKNLQIIIVFFFLIASCKFQKDIDLGYGYTLVVDGDNYIIGKIDVPGKIDSFFFDEKYIFFHQISDTSNYRLHIERKIGDAYTLLTYTGKERINRPLTQTDTLIVRRLKENKYRGGRGEWDSKILNKLADSILVHDPFYKKTLSFNDAYWIIDKHRAILLGPYNLDSFLVKKDSLVRNSKLLKILK